MTFYADPHEVGFKRGLLLPVRADEGFSQRAVKFKGAINRTGNWQKGGKQEEGKTRRADKVNKTKGVFNKRRRDNKFRGASRIARWKLYS